MINKTPQKVRIKKMSTELSTAEYRLSSAIIRQKPKEEIERLRRERDALLKDTSQKR